MHDYMIKVVYLLIAIHFFQVINTYKEDNPILHHVKKNGISRSVCGQMSVDSVYLRSRSVLVMVNFCIIMVQLNRTDPVDVIIHMDMLSLRNQNIHAIVFLRRRNVVATKRTVRIIHF